MSAARSPAPVPLRAPSGVETALPSLSDLDLPEGSSLFDRWYVRRALGRGGFGAVFEAEDRVLEHRVAVKVLDPVLTRRAEVLRRFRREVKALRRLGHRRIVRVFDYSEDPARELALFAMELIRGPSLAELVGRLRERGRGLGPRPCLRIVEQVLEGLHGAHERDVVHGDLTPSNVLLEGADVEELLDGSAVPGVKLVDFGVGGLVDHEERTMRSQVLGTAPYMAPETLGADPVPGELRVAGDLYGVGAIAYELLTTRRAAAHHDREGGAGSDLPGPVRPLVHGMLARDPARRPDVRSALHECRRLRERLEGGRNRRAGPSAGPDREPGSSRPSAGLHSGPSPGSGTGTTDPRRVRALRRRLQRAMDDGDADGVRTTLARLQEALGPAGEHDARVGIAEAWLLSRG